MCALCRIVGHNVFQDTGVEHDEFGEDEVVEAETWWVWRRSDGCVATTNADPREVFDDAYRYYIITVTQDPDEAATAAMMALTAN